MTFWIAYFAGIATGAALIIIGSLLVTASRCSRAEEAAERERAEALRDAYRARFPVTPGLFEGPAE